jgi:hypothetical protein
MRPWQWFLLFAAWQLSLILSAGVVWSIARDLGGNPAATEASPTHATEGGRENQRKIRPVPPEDLARVQDELNRLRSDRDRLSGELARAAWRHALETALPSLVGRTSADGLHQGVQFLQDRFAGAEIPGAAANHPNQTLERTVQLLRELSETSHPGRLLPDAENLLSQVRELSNLLDRVTALQGAGGLRAGAFGAGAGTAESVEALLQLVQLEPLLNTLLELRQQGGQAALNDLLDRLERFREGFAMRDPISERHPITGLLLLALLRRAEDADT